MHLHAMRALVALGYKGCTQTLEGFAADPLRVSPKGFKGFATSMPRRFSSLCEIHRQTFKIFPNKTAIPSEGFWRGFETFFISSLAMGEIKE